MESLTWPHLRAVHVFQTSSAESQKLPVPIFGRYSTKTHFAICEFKVLARIIPNPKRQRGNPVESLADASGYENRLYFGRSMQPVG